MESRFPGVRFVNDLSWHLLDTAVVEVEHGERRWVIKAAGPANHHIGREADAHESFTGIWASQGRAPKLVHGDRSLNLLLTEYVEGCLVEGGAAEYAGDTYLPAGQLLHAFHAQTVRTDPQYEEAATAKAMA